MRVLIADDEPLARVRLRGLLARRADVTVVGEVADGEAMLEACTELAPDLVLLDVEMPGLTGTAAARRLATLAAPPQVVFCTAYEQHALSAFDLGATDYLLKPVRAERLDEALDRAAARRPSSPPRVERGAWLRARSGADEVRVALDDVLYLLADEKYVAVHHAGGMVLIDESLRQLEAAHGERLVRLHRNCLVPRSRLQGLKTLPDGRVRSYGAARIACLRDNLRLRPLRPGWKAMTAPLRIATRKSPLALWQAEHVASLLRQAHPGLVVELVPLSTRGDEILDRSLATIGGKGLFLKELEIAILDGRADIAVHSLKDVPAELEPGFVLSAVLPRADAADAFISNDYATLADLPNGARVGTSSLRRQAQVRALRPDLQLLDLRGNVNTRLAKLDEGQYEAIILACAGVDRLGLSSRIRHRLGSPDWLSAPAQGAIAVESREADARVSELMAALNDAETRIAVDAERAMNEKLGGSCAVAIGAWCVVAEYGLTLHGLVGNAATGELLRAQADSQGDTPVELGHEVAAMLLALGAEELLKPQR